MHKPCIVILGRDDDTTRMLYSALKEEVSVAHVVTEEKIPAWTVAQRRARRLGWFVVLGQMMFVGVLTPYLHHRTRRRRSAICAEHNLTEVPLPASKHTHVSNINDARVLETIQEHQPTHIVVNGTRLISADMINAITVPLINVHLGWNPRYRGGNGGYWALAADDREHCGTTVHLIDTGVDTGSVLARARITPTCRDNFTTYPLLQLAAGIRALLPLLQQATLTPVRTDGEPSAMWYHPTIWGYIWRALRHGVK